MQCSWETLVDTIARPERCNGTAKSMLREKTAEFLDSALRASLSAVHPIYQEEHMMAREVGRCHLTTP